MSQCIWVCVHGWCFDRNVVCLYEGKVMMMMRRRRDRLQPKQEVPVHLSVFTLLSEDCFTSNHSCCWWTQQPAERQCETTAWTLVVTSSALRKKKSCDCYKHWHLQVGGWSYHGHGIAGNSFLGQSGSFLPPMIGGKKKKRRENEYRRSRPIESGTGSSLSLLICGTGSTAHLNGFLKSHGSQAELSWSCSTQQLPGLLSPLTLLTSKKPYTWQPSFFCSCIFWTNPSLLHCSMVSALLKAQPRRLYASLTSSQVLQHLHTREPISNFVCVYPCDTLNLYVCVCACASVSYCRSSVSAP